MSLDLGSPAIEIAIALSFVFFLLSVIVTACTEIVAWATKQRAKQLIKGIEGLIGDPEVAAQVLEHPLVQSDNTTPPDEKQPSYVSARNFAMALMDTVRQGGQTFEALKANVATLPEGALKAQLEGLLTETESDVAAFRKSVEGWFDDAMDRVSGWYKRWSQWWTLGIAIVVAVGLNASTVRIVEHLAKEPAVRTAVVGQAEAAGEAEQPEAADTPKEAGEKIEAAYSELGDLKLPLMWSDENVPDDPKGWGLTAIGWALTVVALTLGAPFWFDTMGKLSRLRSAGRRPEDEPTQTP